MKPAIHDRGRGPEIVGSRITVYDVLAETRAGVPVEQLAREWGLSVEQIEFALKYIDDHREEVERDWAEIQARNERWRVEAEAKYAAILASTKPANPELWERFQKAKAERRACDEGHTGGCQSSRADGTHPSRTGKRVE